ncbi:hypothetical protein ON010_g10777 [Phytophthora cinnamomi]|nr:hypothetical protein ON010_g10777 [Phytophthora cinnamomi]
MPTVPFMQIKTHDIHHHAVIVEESSAAAAGGGEGLRSGPSEGCTESEARAERTVGVLRYHQEEVPDAGASSVFCRIGGAHDSLPDGPRDQRSRGHSFHFSLCPGGFE